MLRTLCAIILCFLAMGQVCLARPLNGPVAYRMGVDQWPPYEFVEDDEAYGISVEVTNSVLKRLGKRLGSMTEVPWKRGLNMLTHGELDLLVSGVKTPMRETVFHYPDEPLITGAWCLFVLKDSGIANLQDLSGKRLGLVIGYQYPETVMTRFRDNISVQYVTDDETNVRKLINGRLDAFVADRLNGLWLVQSLKLSHKIVPSDQCFGERRIYALFSRETVSAEMVKAFSRELVRFKNTPEYREIVSRYSPSAESR